MVSLRFKIIVEISNAETRIEYMNFSKRAICEVVRLLERNVGNVLVFISNLCRKFV